MKKFILKTTFIFACGLLLLTSCLGDGGSNNNSATGVLAYIKSSDEFPHGRYAYIVGYYRMRSDDLDVEKRVSEGDFAYVDYKFNANSVSNSMYNAEYIKIDENNERIFREKDNIHAQTSLDFDTTQVVAGMKPFYIVEAATFIASSDIYLDNKWVFTYAYSALESELAPELVVSYDPNTQYNLAGKPLESNERIVDLQLKKRNSQGTGDLIKIKKTCVIDATLLRYEFTDLAKEDVVKIRFRYYKEDITNKEKGYRLTLANPFSNGPLHFFYEKNEIEE